MVANRHPHFRGLDSFLSRLLLDIAFLASPQLTFAFRAAYHLNIGCELRYIVGSTSLLLLSMSLLCRLSRDVYLLVGALVPQTLQ